MKTYYLLTKPGIILGNLITTAGGFILGSKGHFNGLLFFYTMFGLALVIASACIFNNYIDRMSDQLMERTKNRPLAKGAICEKKAIGFALFLGLMGLFFLLFFTNWLSTAAASLGFLIYVGMYSFWKYRTSLATFVGSISGALPPVVGYLAALNRLDLGALLLFAILVFWQMPHFFSIALFRLEDYQKATIPVLPLKEGILATKVQMLLYIIAFTLTSVSLTLFGYLSTTFALVALVLGSVWLFLCIKGFTSPCHQTWGRQMFRFSLVVVTVLCIMIPVDLYW